METQFVLATIRQRALRRGFRGTDLDDAVQHAYLHLWKYCRVVVVGNKRHAWKMIRPIDQALYVLNKPRIDARMLALFYESRRNDVSDRRESLWRVHDFAEACRKEGDTGKRFCEVLKDSSGYYKARGTRTPSAASIAKFIGTTSVDLKRVAMRTRIKLKEVSMHEN